MQFRSKKEITQAKQNFCGGFKIHRKQITTPATLVTRIGSQTPQQQQHPSRAPIKGNVNKQLIQNGIYYGQFGQIDDIATNSKTLKSTYNNYTYNDQQTLVTNLISEQPNTQSRRRSQQNVRPQSSNVCKGRRNYSIIQQLKGIPVTVYPDYRNSIKNTISIVNPIRNSQRHNTSNEKYKPQTIEEKYDIKQDVETPTSKLYQTTASDKIISQFFQGKYKKTRPQTATINKQQNIVDINVQMQEWFEKGNFKNNQKAPNKQNETNSTRQNVKLKGSDFLQTNDELNQSIDELQDVANILLTRINNDSRVIYSIEGKNVIIRQNDNDKTPIHTQRVLKRPNTSNGQRSSNPSLFIIGKQQTSNEVENTLDRFAIGDVIGKGSYASVRLARDKLTGRQVAIKTYDKSKLTDIQKRNNVKREVQILNRIQHPNIIKLFMTINTETSINLVMEYPGNISMRQYLKQFENRQLNEDDCKQKYRQIVQAIDCCHNQNIIHRDIKLENILLDNQNNIKVIDFGFAIQVNDGAKLNVFCGTPSYMAPEIVSKQEYYGKSIDIWSLGVLLYVFLNGQFPFRGKNDGELFKAIKSGVFKMNKSISFSGQRLINNILKVNYLERYNTRDILNDSWLN